jgi:hypothetical protein
MSGNKSQHQLRTIAMAAPIAHYLEHGLFVECSTCQRWDLIRLDRFGHDLIIGHVVARLKCQQCKIAPTVVILTDAKMRRQVRLVGPGALG